MIGEAQLPCRIIPLCRLKVYESITIREQYEFGMLAIRAIGQENFNFSCKNVCLHFIFLNNTR